MRLSRLFKKGKGMFSLRLLALMTVFSICAVYSVNWYLDGLEHSVLAQVELVEAVAVSRDLNAGCYLERSDLTTSSVPRAALLSGYSTDIESLVGKRLVVPVQQGEQITTQKIAEPGDIATTPGKRWYLLDSATSGDEGFFEVGDRVDVLGVLATEAGERRSIVILQDVLVAQLRQPDEGLYGMQGDSRGVVLELTLAEAQKLALAQEMGPVRLIRRSGSDLAIVPGNPITLQDVMANPVSVTQVQYRRFEIISGVESQSVYLPASKRGENDEK